MKSPTATRMDTRTQRDPITGFCFMPPFTRKSVEKFQTSDHPGQCRQKRGRQSNKTLLKIVLSTPDPLFSARNSRLPGRRYVTDNLPGRIYVTRRHTAGGKCGMSFSEQPPSKQWAALRYRGDILAEVWFKPEGEPFALTFRIPQKSFQIPGISERLTAENLLKAVAITTEEVESWRHGGVSQSDVNGSNPEFGRPLPPPPQDVSHLAIEVRLKPPPQIVAPDTRGVPEISARKSGRTRSTLEGHFGHRSEYREPTPKGWKAFGQKWNPRRRGH